MKNFNRRESPRIDIRLRCHITAPAVWMRVQVETENISRNGILVAWRGLGSERTAVPVPAEGDILTVEIELPANHGFGQKCIHCQGTVTRVDFPENDDPLVAMDVNYMDFRTFQSRVRSVEALQPAMNSWMA